MHSECKRPHLVCVVRLVLLRVVARISCIGRVTYGYKVESGSLVVDEEQAEVIRRIFRLRLQGKTLLGIAKELDASGVKPSLGKQWGDSSISNIVDRPFYAGYYRHKGVLKRGSHEPIIDVETFNAAQRVFHNARDKLFEPRRIQLPMENEDARSESSTQTR